MQRYEFVIIGGGIIGLSVAWAIQEKRPGARIALLEKEDRFASHQTGRNSGVIHSGLYYKPGSIKASLCREGRGRLLQFCESHGIPYETCGKVIVATDSSQMAPMEDLYRRGVENGLAVEKLSASEVREREPHVNCLAGILVPSAGIVDYARVSEKIAELIGRQGGEIRLRERVLRIRGSAENYLIETSSGELMARSFVNCAGLHSDRVARLAGVRPGARIVPFRGEYYELRPECRYLVKNLIYPVPDPRFPFLGVHFTRMIDGSVHAGPNAVLSLKREGYHRWSFGLRDFVDTVSYPGFWRLAARNLRPGLEEMRRSVSKGAFVRSLRKLIPEVGADDLVPSAAGVRAQALWPDGQLVDDFLLVPDGARSLHVCNAPSPAATASLAIASYVVEKLL